VRLAALGQLPFSLVTVPMRLDLDDWAALSSALEHALTHARRVA
jgi:hypothetical protein